MILPSSYQISDSLLFALVLICRYIRKICGYIKILKNIYSRYMIVK